MNWKLIFSLSSFGVGMELCSLMGLGPFLIFLWPIVIVTSVCLIGARAPGRFALHGFMAGAMMQLWAGAIHAYYIFDLSRIGLVEVTPHRIHPQLINALETAAAAAVTGAVIAALLLLTTKLEQRRISQAR
ncbi:MAG TPA: hypothetical protein DC054_19690 [Blastocatellia bacterium]|nr:hypothetical protein [Blastocatellia bacterium]